jgi:hypothetical protein
MAIGSQKLNGHTIGQLHGEKESGEATHEYLSEIHVNG